MSRKRNATTLALRWLILPSNNFVNLWIIHENKTSRKLWQTAIHENMYSQKFCKKPIRESKPLQNYKKRSFARIKSNSLQNWIFAKKKSESFLKYFDYRYIGNIHAMLEGNIKLQTNSS